MYGSLLRDCFLLSTFAHLNLFPLLFQEIGLNIIDTFRPSLGIAGLPFLELTVLGRLPMAHLVVTRHGARPALLVRPAIPEWANLRTSS